VNDNSLEKVAQGKHKNDYKEIMAELPKTPIFFRSWANFRDAFSGAINANSRINI